MKTVFNIKHLVIKIHFVILFVCAYSPIYSQEASAIAPSATNTTVDLKMEIKASSENKPAPKPKNRLSRKSKEALETEIATTVSKYSAIKNCGSEVTLKCESFILAKLDSAWTEDDYTLYLTKREQAAIIQKYMEAFPIPDDCKIKKPWTKIEKEAFINTIKDFFDTKSVDVDKLATSVFTNCPDYASYLDYMKNYEKSENLENYKKRLAEYIENCAKKEFVNLSLVLKTAEPNLLNGSWKNSGKKLELTFDKSKLKITKTGSREEPRTVENEWQVGSVIELEEGVFYKIISVDKDLLILSDPEDNHYEFRH